MPNVFTPNGDIFNQTFRPVFNGLSNIKLYIYDQRGNLIRNFDSDVATDQDPDSEYSVSLLGWDGNYNDGSKAEEQYYIYMIYLIIDRLTPHPSNSQILQGKSPSVYVTQANAEPANSIDHAAAVSPLMHFAPYRALQSGLSKHSNAYMN